MRRALLFCPWRGRIESRYRLPVIDRPLSSREDAASNPKRRSLGCLAALLGLAVIAAGLAAFVFYRTQTAASSFVRDAFLAVAHLQPKVTVDERVVFEQTTPALELAVVERDVSVERETADSWLGSTKRLRVRATYRIKAGFDLRQPFDVKVQPGMVWARLPAARLLSAEQVRLEALDVRNGMWNRVANDEIKAELNTLNAEARLKALSAGMPREAEAMLTKQLREKLGAQYPVDVVYGSAAPVLR